LTWLGISYHSVSERQTAPSDHAQVWISELSGATIVPTDIRDSRQSTGAMTAPNLLAEEHLMPRIEVRGAPRAVRDPGPAMGYDFGYLTTPAPPAEELARIH
jgi:hypothetical protein